METNFLGTGWSFPPSFDRSTKQVVMVSGEDDIRQSLQILFNTVPGERTMLPKFGCNVKSFLFENIDTSMEFLLKDQIANAILNYESRIQLMDLSIDSSEAANGLLTVTIDYMIRSTNSRNNMVFPFYITEGTLLQQT